MSTPAGSNAPIPYVAPWAAQFNRYSTQVLNMAATNATQYVLTIPDGQWWRVVFAQVRWGTSATAGTRLAQFDFDRPTAQDMLTFAPATQGVSLTGNYLYGPGLSAYSVTIAGSLISQVIAWPDLMWGPKTALTAHLTNAQTGDLAVNTPFVAVEIYTEHVDPGSGETLLVPSPVLT